MTKTAQAEVLASVLRGRIRNGGNVDEHFDHLLCDALRADDADDRIWVGFARWLSACYTADDFETFDRWAGKVYKIATRVR